MGGSYAMCKTNRHNHQVATSCAGGKPTDLIYSHGVYSQFRFFFSIRFRTWSERGYELRQRIIGKEEKINSK